MYPVRALNTSGPVPSCILPGKTPHTCIWREERSVGGENRGANIHHVHRRSFYVLFYWRHPFMSGSAARLVVVYAGV